MSFRTIFFIAKRLLISKQKKTAVSVISWIAILGMLVSTAAMVILLSAFNGIEGMIEGMYTEFDQEIIVTPKSGRKLSESEFSEISKVIQETKGVLAQSFYIQDRVIIRKNKKWSNADLWAVESSFYRMANMNDSMHLINGVQIQKPNEALIGVGLANKLKFRSMDSEPEQVLLYIPRQDRKIRIGKTPFFQTNLSVVGALDYNKEINQLALVLPLDFALDYFDNKISGLLVATDINQRDNVLSKIKLKFGNQFKIQTNLEKNELIFKTSQSEKMIVIIILVFVFVLSLFNLSAALSMTFLEKKENFKTLKALGVSENGLMKTFILLGSLVVFIGVFIGLLLGVTLVLIHKYFELIIVPGSQNPFPADLQIFQLILVCLFFILLGLLASFFTTRFLINQGLKENQVY